jgi:hypothetical protein
MMLWDEMKERLQANNPVGDDGDVRRLDGRVLVGVSRDFWPEFDEGDKMLDYVAWVKWQLENRPGVLK